MAVFLVAADGLAAALDILDEIKALNERQPHRPALRIKLGLHRGSCVAISANDVMDYFGTTVNVAARVHAQSRGGDIVVTETMMDDPGVRNVVERRGVQPERFETTLPGFDDTFPLFRLQGGEDD